MAPPPQPAAAAPSRKHKLKPLPEPPQRRKGRAKRPREEPTNSFVVASGGDEPETTEALEGERAGRGSGVGCRGARPWSRWRVGARVVRGCRIQVRLPGIGGWARVLAARPWWVGWSVEG